MKTIGKLLKDSRTAKNLSKSHLEKETKIKKDFIVSLESEEWEKLPDYPVVQGFVRSISQILEIDTERAVATLRRDYPPKTLSINPKPDISSRFRWNPKLTFIVGVLLVSFSILGYLGFQYASFRNPPKLLIKTPQENQEIYSNIVLVEGMTDTDSVLTVNNQSVLVSQNGDFSVELEITKDTKELIARTKSRSGKETTIHRKIKPVFE